MIGYKKLLAPIAAIGMAAAISGCASNDDLNAAMAAAKDAQAAANKAQATADQALATANSAKADASKALSTAEQAAADAKAANEKADKMFNKSLRK